MNEKSLMDMINKQQKSYNKLMNKYDQMYKTYSINKNDYYNSHNDEWIKDPYNEKELEKLMDMVKDQKENTTVLGTLKIRDNKLIVEHKMKEIVLCDLNDDSAAAAIMAAIAKIQLEEMNNAK